MSSFDQLSSIYQSLTGSANDSLTTVEELAERLLENFDESLELFIDSSKLILDANPESIDDIYIGFKTFLKAILEIDLDDRRVLLLLKAWFKIVGISDNSKIDLLTRLYSSFSVNYHVLLRIIKKLLSIIGNFELFFKTIVLHASNNLFHFRDALQTTILPVSLGALLGLDSENVANAIIKFLRSEEGSLTRRISAFDLGFPQAGLSSHQIGEIQRRFPNRTNVAVIALLVDAIRSISGFNLSLNANSPGFSNSTLVSTYFFGEPLGLLPEIREKLSELINLITEAAENELFIEMRVLEIARFFPAGILFFKFALVNKVINSPAPWIELVLNPIEDTSNLIIKRLPPPSENQKYFIFSDIHRDAQSDSQPPFQFGSIDHFMSNAELYLEILNYLADQGYTIIENGDCEELWFYRDFPFDPKRKLDEIVNQTHSAIYNKLRDLHQEGRYFRTFGNHDSYLRNPDVFAILEQHMDPNGNSKFSIFDFIIIESVKTMHDIPFHFGLNSDPNVETMPFVITHGHQWDFWNCDKNSILGKLIVTIVVTPLDLLDDPVRDLAGISGSGSPMINFKTNFSNLPIYNSWNNYEPGVLQMDRIQHVEDTLRRFSDNIQYSETLASLMGLLIAIRQNPGDDPILKLSDELALFSMLCIGHTHNPHNEPYYDLKGIPYFGDAVTGFQNALHELPGMSEAQIGLVKSLFLNSGVSGWTERCISGIDLGNESHGTAQPKLVYWTHNTRIDRPNHMDWELPHIPASHIKPPEVFLKNTINDLFIELETLKSGYQQNLKSSYAIPLVKFMNQALIKWMPWDIELVFDKEIRTTLQQLLAHITFGILKSRETRKTIKINVRIMLPIKLKDQLFETIKDQTIPRNGNYNDRISAAISILTFEKELSIYGFRHGPSKTPITPELSALISLQTLCGFRGLSGLTIDFSPSENPLLIEINIHASKLNQKT